MTLMCDMLNIRIRHTLFRLLSIVALWCGWQPCAFSQSSDHDFELARQLDIFANVYTQLDMYYVDTLQAKTQIEGAIAEMLSTIDPYTVYYPEQRRDELLQFVSGRYAGIGISFRVNDATRRAEIIVVERDSPAEKAGLRIGDQILRIDNHDVGQAASTSNDDKKEYTLALSQRLRGEPGSSIDIEVMHYGQNRAKSITIYRQLITQKSIPFAAMLSDSIGYVRLMAFNENTPDELRSAVATLKHRGAQKLILDLRDNPGGTLLAAVRSVALFVPRETEVVRTRGRNRLRPDEVHATDVEPIDEFIPIAIVVDDGTASAAEITAGALQDYDRGVVIGRRTYGKGLVQSTYELPYGGLLKLTSARFYIPSGRCIQALDYSRRTPSGDPMPLPDSLTQAFLTSAGRTVYDGGGITPDILVETDTVPQIVGALLQSDVFYDYVANYVTHHHTIDTPLKFQLTDAEYTAFKKAVITSRFEFGSSTRKALEYAQRIAHDEGFGQDFDAEIGAITARLSAEPDRLLERWRLPVKRALEHAIVGAYYGAAGQVEYSLQADKDITESIRVLREDRRYRSILTTAPER